MATPAAFANAGCGTHQVAIGSFFESQGTNDQVSVSYDFQCGGTTSNWRIVLHLQDQNSSGNWVNQTCGHNNPATICTVYRPGSSSFYTSGTEHGCLNAGCGPDLTWNPDVDVEGGWWRVQVIVHFANGDPNLTYYSNEAKG